ncbi:50S ribosomal protein L9 [Patescibacteria group bacterium]|nr:50S ribosomal protein L9 [Patescibacteria group bacterium]MDE1946524.1 50S ribosomal protein L9 [Patescibacteria group bacterium]MDE2010915.1 50S ribosomal protein L9 [Patescibacteria group bacterium]MDE2233644.1 50S ribosomal protein L9 [Patescibacteria group bacterium]
MKIILLKDIPKLGRRFDIKEVNSGHAINFLIPKGMALEATPAVIKKVELEKARAEGERKMREELLVKNIEGLDGLTLNVSGKTNEKGHLFAAIHADTIAEELEKQARIQVNPSFIVLDHPIKETGEHAVKVRAHDKTVKFALVVKGDSE